MKTLENVPFKLQTALGGEWGGGENWMMIEGREKRSKLLDFGEEFYFSEPNNFLF